MLDSGVGPFVAHALEECIAEHTVPLCRSVKISDACVEALRLVSLAAIAAPRMPSIMAVKVETRLDHQRVKLRADQRVASGLPLQCD